MAPAPWGARARRNTPRPSTSPNCVTRPTRGRCSRRSRSRRRAKSTGRPCRRPTANVPKSSRRPLSGRATRRSAGCAPSGPRCSSCRPTSWASTTPSS
eukprot:7129864-Prymnesium_polylepis.1